MHPHRVHPSRVHPSPEHPSPEHLSREHQSRPRHATAAARAARSRPPRPHRAGRRARRDDRCRQRSQRAACLPGGCPTTCRDGRRAPTDRGHGSHAPGRGPTAAVPDLAVPAGCAGPGRGGVGARHRRPAAARTAPGSQPTAAARRSTAGSRVPRGPGRRRSATTRRGRRRPRDALAARPAPVRVSVHGPSGRGPGRARRRPCRIRGRCHHDAPGGRATAPAVGGAPRLVHRCGGRRWQRARPGRGGRDGPAMPTPRSSVPEPGPPGPRHPRGPSRRPAHPHWNPTLGGRRWPGVHRRDGRHGAHRRRTIPRPAGRPTRGRSGPHRPAPVRPAAGRHAGNGRCRPDHGRIRRQPPDAGPASRSAHTHRGSRRLRRPGGRPSGRRSDARTGLARRSAAGADQTWPAPRRWRHRRTNHRGRGSAPGRHRSAAPPTVPVPHPARSRPPHDHGSGHPRTHRPGPTGHHAGGRRPARAPGHAAGAGRRRTAPMRRARSLCLPSP
ncbi:hypothetical protein FraQA3DRAFT_6339 [Frankia sp. QA3]|nr:hypothetical protein FraQA3DRAFT_6339 [Frankia sp. QA3]